MEISILKNFSEYPGLRHCKISDKSGEEFYHNILNEMFFEVIDSDEKLTGYIILNDQFLPC